MNVQLRKIYEFGVFRLDTAEHLLLREDKPVALNPKAFEVLLHLIGRRGHLVEKDELMREVWADSFVEEANVARTVWALRKALGENGNEQNYIQTVPKHGYRFVADVVEIPIEEMASENGAARSIENSDTKTIAANGNSDEHAQTFIAAGKNEAIAESRETVADDLPVQTKRESRFWLWAVGVFSFCAVAIIGVLFNFSGAKSGDVLTFERMKQTRLTQSGDVFEPTVSPDGQYLVYVNLAGAQRGLRLRQIATGQVLELVPPRPKVNFWSTGFSRDSNYVYYTENKGNDLGIIYRIPSLGGQPQKIAESSGSPTVAPDGMRLAFVRTNKPDGIMSIVVANSDGSNEQMIAAIDTDSIYQSLDWSPDGATIAYAVKHHEPKNDSWYVAEVPADGGAERRIGKPRNSKIIAALWLPDKQGFVLNAIDPQTKQPQIYYLSYTDGTERRITSDLNDYFGVSMTADGKSIVSQRMEQNRAIWILPDGDNTQPARQLTFKKEQHFEAVSWLTNDMLVFDVDENSTFDNHNIWRLKIGDSEPQPLTTGAGDNTLPAVAPDGQTIAFVSSRSGKPQIWRMNADGTQPTQVTDLDYDIFRLQFAPDGRTLYFKTSIGGEGRLLRVSINGGTAVSISDMDIYRWAISPDGKKLAYSSLNRDTQKVVVRIRPIDEDRTEKILDIEPENYLEWAKDGQTLYFTLAADDSKNIWRQSLLETKPQQITDFDKEKIFRFFPSPDGKNLVCIRFTEIFDAVQLNFK